MDALALISSGLGFAGFVSIGSMRLAQIKVDCNGCVMTSFCALMIGVLAWVGHLAMTT